MDHNLDMIFLGGLFPKNMEKEIYEKSTGLVESAANALQWNLIEGIDKNCSKPINIINSLYIGSYPLHYKDLFIKTYSFNHCDESEDINVGFMNLFIVKHIFKYFSLKPHLKKWAESRSENKIIIEYALLAVPMKCLNYVKKINPAVKTCVIVPDIPQYMNTDRKKSVIYTFLKGIEIKIIERNLKYADSYVFLTEYMREFIEVNDNFVVVEGISTDAFKDIEAETDTANKVILYTGTLNRRYGIVNLVEAFKKIKGSEYRLVLCGGGDSEDKIAEEALKDSRIIYKGQLKREDVLKLQMGATVLVNPRQNSEVFTKYSFPSKIIEYLSSGTPVIAYKLDGMPDEYDDYIYYVKEDSIETLSDRLVEVCELDKQERVLFGAKAKEFVLSKKNSQVQTEKIIDMILSL